MVWIPGQLPFHVTDPSKLEIYCPMKYRMYADHIDRNNPMLKVEFRLGHGDKALTGRPGQPNLSAFPLREADPAPDGDGAAAEDLTGLRPFLTFRAMGTLLRPATEPSGSGLNPSSS